MAESDDLLTIPEFLRNPQNVIAEKNARIRELEAALREVFACYVSDDGVWPDDLYARVKALTQSDAKAEGP
jgi:hypothetical protein